MGKVKYYGAILLLLAAKFLFGQAEVVNPVFPFWKTKGNSGVDTANYFIGTTDLNGLSFRTNNIRRMVIDQNGRLGIGTVLPSQSGTVEAINIGGNNAVFISTNYGNPNEFWFRRAQGTISAPTIIGSAGSLGRIDGRGYDGSTFINASRVELLVDSTSAASNMPGRISFSTNPANSTITPIERMRINRKGLVSINLTTEANTYLDVNGDFALREGDLVLVNGNNNNIVTQPYPSGKSFYRVTGPTADFNITGLQGGVDGRILILVNYASDTMNVILGSTLSTPNNRILTPLGTIAIPVYGTITLQYSSSISKWMVLAYNDGTYLSANSNWSLTGNSGTNGSINFMGTTDTANIAFKVNNQKAGRIDWVKQNTFLGYQSANTNNTGSGNTAMGYQALYNNTTSSDLVAIGRNALFANTSGLYLTAVGPYALGNNGAGTHNTAVGYFSQQGNSSGNYNTSLGAFSMYWNSAGIRNTAVGTSALYFTSLSDNTAVGYEALNQNSSGFKNTAVGSNAMRQHFSGYANVAIGDSAAYSSTTSVGNVAIGASALKNVTFGSHMVAIGDSALYSSVFNLSNVGVGAKACYACTSFGNTSVGSYTLMNNATGGINTAMGQNAMRYGSGAAANAAFGYNALANVTGSGNYNVAVGCYSMEDDSTGGYNVAVGTSTLGNNRTGFNNVAIGYNSLLNNNASNNTSVGNSTMINNLTGEYNTALGANALSTSTSANDNTAIGANTLMFDTSGSNNTAVGRFSQSGNRNGDGNTSIGGSALNANITGDYNTAVGYVANVASGNLTNATAIGYAASVGISNAVVLGSNTNVGIGTSTPSLAGLQVQRMINNNVAMFSGGPNSQGLAISADWPGIYFNSYYSAGSKAMASTGYPALINTDQSFGGLTFNTTTTANTVQNAAITTNERMRIGGDGLVSIGGFFSSYLLQLNLNSAAKPGTTTWTVPSDMRLKKDVQPFTQGLNVLNEINPIWFRYNGEGGIKDTSLFVGVSAQDVQKIAPHMIGTWVPKDTLGKPSATAYLDYNSNDLLYIMVNSIKEQQVQIDEIKKQNELQQQEIIELKRQNELLNNKK